MTLIKALCSDFVVRELDANFKPFAITSTDDPMREQFQRFKAFLDPDFKVGNVDFAPLAACGLTEQQIADLAEFIDKEETGSTLEFSAPETKAERTTLYEFLNGLGLPILEAGTRDFKVCLRFHEKVRMPKMPQKTRFLHFTIQKQNMDTQTAIAALCQNLPFYAKHFKPADFSYAGLKDKRGVTTQRICVSNKDAWPDVFIESARKCGLQIGNFEFSDQRIGLGAHGGNEFEVCFRNVSDCEKLVARCATIAAVGFPNKFGSQRFGTCSIKTDEIGLMLLKGDFVAAYKAILLTAVESGRSDEPVTGASLEERFQCANSLLQQKKVFTRVGYMLSQQVSDPQSVEQCRGALLSMPHDARTLYFHAFQSRVFNQIAVSKQLEIGDVVEVENEIAVVTEENKTKYSIYDRVAPLVGYNSYQANTDVFKGNSQVVTQTRTLLEQYGLQIETFPCSAREFIAPGGWRKLENRPLDIKLCYEAHDDVMEEFPINNRTFVAPDRLQLTPKAKYASIIAKFALPASSYATELMGEILEQEYNIEQQKRLMEQLHISEAPP